MVTSIGITTYDSGELIMAIWDKVKEGIDKAGKAAQEALDEGKTRIEGYRAREKADKAAEALGYAVFRAAEGGRELDTEARERLMRALREQDGEAHRLETELAADDKTKPTAAPPDGESPGSHPPTPAASSTV